MRRNLNLEGPNIFVVDGQVMRGLGSNLDFGRCLRGQKWSQQQEKQEAFHW